MARNDLIDVEVFLKHETDAAWLVEDSSGTSTWVPKSQGEISIGADGRGVLTIPEWLADEKELA